MYINKTPVGASATETDPKKEAADAAKAAAEAARIAEFHRQRSSRNPTVIKDSSSYVSNVGMTEGRGEGTIASYGDLNDANLSEEAKANILKSPFGREYLSGDGTILEQYRVYTDKVNSYISNNPTEALARAKDMAETNPNFKTKLKNNDGTWKTDKEILSITRTMMTDGKIGDFHGQLLSTKKVSPTMGFYNPTDVIAGANYRQSPHTPYAVSLGNRTIGKNSMNAYLQAAAAAGFSRADLQTDSEEVRQFLSDFMDNDRNSQGELSFQQTAPMPEGGVGSTSDGAERGGWNDFFLNEASNIRKEGLSVRKDNDLEIKEVNNMQVSIDKLKLERGKRGRGTEKWLAADAEIKRLEAEMAAARSNLPGVMSVSKGGQ